MCFVRCFDEPGPLPPRPQVEECVLQIGLDSGSRGGPFSKLNLNSENVNCVIHGHRDCVLGTVGGKMSFGLTV